VALTMPRGTDNATWHWQCHVSHRDLTRGITMPHGTDNATCHTQEPDIWHFL